MAKVERIPAVPVEDEIVLRLSENEAKYVMGALLSVNPSKESGLQCDTVGGILDPVYDALIEVVMYDEDEDDASWLQRVVPSGNTPEGTR